MSAKPTITRAMTRRAGEQRFQEAFDLLNGRWVDPEAKENFYRFLDGEIDTEEAARRLL